MPGVPTSTTNVPGQVNPNARPANTQMNFGQLYRRVQQYNPDLDPTEAQMFVQNSYRRVIDSRSWYGLMVKGQVNVPTAYTTGSASTVNGSAVINISGGAVDNTFIGRQFRVGFATPIYTITSVQSATQFTLDLPWGGYTQNNVGYNIFQNIVSLGYNVKRVLAMVNQVQGYRLRLGMPQEVINIFDTWRTQTGWTYLLANYAPAPDGSPQFELYPAPTFQQSFPFLAYIQPPDLIEEGDYPYTFIRSDVILYGAIIDALTFHGQRMNRFYDPQVAMMYQQRYMTELNSMIRNDDAQYPQDLLWEFNRYPFTQYGADFWQSHDEALIP